MDGDGCGWMKMGMEMVEIGWRWGRGWRWLGMGTDMVGDEWRRG